MTETHELNRPVICLRYAARGVTQLVMTDSVGQLRSHYQLCVVGALRLSTVVVADLFFERVQRCRKRCAKHNLV